MPKFIHIKKHNPESMMKFKTELMKLDIYNNLNKDDFADPNENYNLPEEMITDSSNVPSALNSLERPATDGLVNYDIPKTASYPVSRSRSSPVPGVVAYFRHGYATVQDQGVVTAV